MFLGGNAGTGEALSADTRPKGEYAISVTIAGAVVLIALLFLTRWQPQKLRDMASSAEEFILTSTGLAGQVPDIAGFEKLKTFRLGSYRAGVYRITPSPLLFAIGRFVLYNRSNQPVLRLETLEGSREVWTDLYDFAGQHGAQARGIRARPAYTRNLAGSSDPDIIVGQYSGGDHCCTTATVVELGKESAKVLATIEAVDGFPFDGLEVKKLDKGPDWQIVVKRRYETLCGPSEDGADVVSVFAYSGGQYTDQTLRFTNYLGSLLRQNLEQWSEVKKRTLRLLQNVAAEYAMIGQRELGKRFFAADLPQFAPELEKNNADPEACQEDLEYLLDQLPSP
jgi:hypothetical protein